LGTVQSFGGLGGGILPWLQGQVGAGNNGGMVVPLVLSFLMLGIVFATRLTSPRKMAV